MANTTSSNYNYTTVDGTFNNTAIHLKNMGKTTKALLIDCFKALLTTYLLTQTYKGGSNYKFSFGFSSFTLYLMQLDYGQCDKKSSPIFHKSCPKKETLQFYVPKSWHFSNIPKTQQKFGLHLQEKIVTRTFKNSPIRPHWLWLTIWRFLCAVDFVCKREQVSFVLKKRWNISFVWNRAIKWTKSQPHLL